MAEFLDKNGLQYFWDQVDGAKQDILVSGENIKTINNNSILGSGNLDIEGGGGVTDVEVNGSSVVTAGVAEVTVPTETSDLVNDSDFVSDSSYVHTDNNFTTTLKDKLDGIESGAEVNVQANWTEADSGADSYIQNKPSVVTDVDVDGSSVVSSGVAYVDLTGKQDALVSGTNIKTINNNSILGSGNLVIGGGGGISDVQVDGVSVVTGGVAEIDLTGKQDTLVSGTNIKTINNISLLGSGNITDISPVETITPSITATTGTVTDISARKTGNVVQLSFWVFKSSTAAGGTIFSGTLSAYKPCMRAASCGSYGQVICNAKLNADGSIVVENTSSSTLVMSTGYPMCVAFTYITI